MWPHRRFCASRRAPRRLISNSVGHSAALCEGKAEGGRLRNWGYLYPSKELTVRSLYVEEGASGHCNSCVREEMPE